MYTKFTWVGNKIADKDMERLYKLKATTRKTITQMVAEAVIQYINAIEGGVHHEGFGVK